MDLKINYCRKLASITLSTEFAGGYDVTAAKIVRDKRFVKVYLGIKSEIPVGWRVRVVPRSSFTHTSWIMANTPGMIDADYRGEWIIKMELVTPTYQLDMFKEAAEIKYDKEFPYKEGDRCAQIYAEKIEPLNIIEVAEHDLDPSERGSGGFGSTGK